MNAGEPTPLNGLCARRGANRAGCCGRICGGAVGRGRTEGKPLVRGSPASAAYAMAPPTEEDGAAPRELAQLLRLRAGEPNLRRLRHRRGTLSPRFAAADYRMPEKGQWFGRGSPSTRGQQRGARLTGRAIRPSETE